MLGEDPVEKCWSEIVNIDVNVVGIINGIPAKTVQRLSGNDHALVQSKAFQYILYKKIF